MLTGRSRERLDAIVAEIRETGGHALALSGDVTSESDLNAKAGETYALVFNPRHRWYYFPNMTPDEFLLLKIYDSAGDGIARLTAHTAFDDRTTPADAPRRRSIELRTLLFF